VTVSLLLRALLGAVLVVLITLIARTRNYYVAGLLPLFPIFALVAHATVGSELGPAALRTTAVFGLWSLLPYAAYLITVHQLAGRFGLGVTLISAIGVWLLSAAALVLLWSSFTSQPRV
jgi:membrane protein GlpM